MPISFFAVWNERRACLPESTHVNFMEPCVGRVERIEVVFHDETKVTDPGNILPTKIAEQRGTDSPNKSHSIGKVVGDTTVNILFTDPWLVNGPGQHS